MPLEATHIKFALDIKDKYQPDNLSQYLSGTIYPDSRYITKLNRKLCHDQKTLAPDFADTDFKKGWAAHFLCDLLSSQVINKMVPELLTVPQVGVGGTPWWINKTAIKSIIDMQVCHQFDVQPYLPLLKYVENPHDEPIEQIERYNQIIQKTYNHKQQITIADIKQMWLDLGIGQEMADKVAAQTKKFLQNDELMEKISQIYQEMIKLAQKHV